MSPYLAYPSPPDASEIEQMISFQVGLRSDATAQFGRTPPRSMFDLERDAEVQEIQRCLARLQTDTEVYLDVQRMRTTRFMQFMRVFAGLLVLALAVVAFSVWEMRAAQAPQLNLVVSPTPEPTPTPAPLTVSPVVVDLPDATVAEVVQKDSATPTPVKAVEPVVVAAVTPAAEKPPIPPKAAPVPVAAAVPKPVATPAPASPVVSAAKPAAVVRAPVPAVAAAKPAKTALPKDDPTPSVATAKVAPTKDKAPTTAGAPEPRDPEEKLFALEGGQPVASPTAAPPRPVREPVKEFPKEPVKEPVRTHAVTTPTPVAAERPVSSTNVTTPGAGAPARHDRYSARGVITMTGSGVVIFDQERRSQRLIPIGARLPDGTLLKGVDVKSNRISTDAGDVIFD